MRPGLLSARTSKFLWRQPCLCFFHHHNDAGSLATTLRVAFTLIVALMALMALNLAYTLSIDPANVLGLI